MILNVTQAARLAGRSRQTIYAMRSDGRLSFTQSPDTGVFGIELSELLRVFPKAKLPKDERQDSKSIEQYGASNQSDEIVTELRAQIKTLELLIGEKDERIHLLLTIHKATKEAPESPPIPTQRNQLQQKSRRSLFDRLSDGVNAALK